MRQGKPAKQGDQQVPFAEFFSQDREEVPWDAVSQYAKDAAIATEDPRYYEHGGVDVLSAARALAQNVLNKEVQSGASTITMQYVRNVLVQKAQNMVDSSDEATQAGTQFGQQGKGAADSTTAKISSTRGSMMSESTRRAALRGE